MPGCLSGIVQRSTGGRTRIRKTAPPPAVAEAGLGSRCSALLPRVGGFACLLIKGNRLFDQLSNDLRRYGFAFAQRKRGQLVFPARVESRFNFAQPLAAPE